MRIAQLPFLFCCLLSFSGCSDESVVSHERPKIEALRKRPLTSRILLEGEEEVILKIGDREFGKIRGAPPYHVEVKDTDMIYFVSEGRNHQSVCHLYNLKTRKDIEILTDLTELGYDIGRTGERREVVESASTNWVRIARFHGDRKTLYTLDLAKRQVSDAKIVNLNKGTTN
jgi:hypothetical protein